jgi:hypothetical protein
MKRKRYYIYLFIILLFGAVGCSNKSVTKSKQVSLDSQSVGEMVEVQRLNQLGNESAVTFADSKDIRILKEAVKTAVKEPGIANISDPIYKVTLGEDLYFLWLINGHGTVMNTKDTILYNLLDESTNAIEQLFAETFPAIKKDGTLDMSSYSDFPMDANNVGSYIGALEPTPIEKVKNGVYINGVHAHGDRQSFQIFSKVSQGDYQCTTARLEGENLIIEITSHEAKNGEVSYPFVIHGLSIKENPRYYVVIRNGITEKKEKIAYGIE